MGILDGLGGALRNQLAYIGQTDAENQQRALAMMQQGFVPQMQAGGLPQQLLRAFAPQVQGPESFQMAPWQVEHVA